MIKKLEEKHTQAFCDLIIDMYSHLDNLEWFSPMPYDYDNVKSMITNDRFYIIGYFDGETLCGVSSLDYKCGKLIGKVDLPSDTSIVEIGFNIVHSKYRGQGIMAKMVSNLLDKVKADGFEWVFAKVHRDNLASSRSLLKNSFNVYSSYTKPVKVVDFVNLSSADFFSKVGKENAKNTLSRYSENDTEIFVDYNIITKKL